jgi:hypothetical protein
MVEDAAAALTVVRTVLKRQGISIAKLERITPSLEDVFVSLIAGEKQKLTERI